MADKIFDYLEGKKLYGDDFSQAEINEWYIDELEGYADLGAKDRGSYDYEYHELNKFHAFSLIKNRNFKKALGIGSAYGDEFMPIANNIEHITIIDPSEVFSSVKKIANTPCEYIKPQ